MLTIDLGDLRPAAQAAAVSQGTPRLGTWVRGLIAREVATTSPAEPSSKTAELAPQAPAGPPIEIRWLADASLVTRLDELVDRGGFRSRSAALNALLFGADLGGGPELADAVRAMTRSSDDLVTIRRQLQRIAEAIAQQPQSPLLVARQLELEACGRLVRDHLARASRVLSRLAPGLRPSPSAERVA